MSDNLQMKYDIEFVSILNKLGIPIAIENQEFWFDVLEDMFPIGLNRIAWQKVSETEVISLSDVFKNKDEAKRKIFDFMASKFEQNKINEDDLIIVLSDGALEETYSFKVSDWKQIFEYVFFLPQHTYVIPKKGQWCMNYTFEDDLFFGISPKAIPLL